MGFIVWQILDIVNFMCFILCVICYYFGGKCHTIRQLGPWFNINMPSCQYRKSHCWDKTIVRPSYFHNGISYTGKMTSLYWIRALTTLYCVGYGVNYINIMAYLLTFVGRYVGVFCQNFDYLQHFWMISECHECWCIFLSTLFSTLRARDSYTKWCYDSGPLFNRNRDSLYKHETFFSLQTVFGL